MQASYHLNVDELTDDFINMLKSQFHNGILDIIVTENDETDYLFSSKKNKELLEESLAEMDTGIYISKSLSDLEK